MERKLEKKLKSRQKRIIIKIKKPKQLFKIIFCLSFETVIVCDANFPVTGTLVIFYEKIKVILAKFSAQSMSAWGILKSTYHIYFPGAAYYVSCQKEIYKAKYGF